MSLFSITYQTISLINAPKIDTALLWDLTIMFGCIAIVYFTAIFFYRNKISGKSNKVSTLKTDLSPMISEFIFYEDDASKEEKSHYINLKVQIRDMLRDDFTRTVVSEILLDLRKDVSGNAQERLFGLFQDLNLHKESYKKLKSWRWERISTGIQELTRMEVNDSYEFITKFINDKRGTIRKQSEIGVVTLHDEGINYFLDTTRHRISEWQQLKLIEVLSNKTDFEPPSFAAWLTSTNKFVVLFALRLIKYYDQNDAKASIVELVKHRDNQIKEEALDCIKAFYLTKALPTLKKVFWSCSTDIKISILGTIGALGTPNDIPFLQSIGNKESNYSVTSKALSAINAIAPESVLPTQDIADIDTIEIPEDLTVEDSTPTLEDSEERGHKEQIEKEEPVAEDDPVFPQEVATPPIATTKPAYHAQEIRDLKVIFSTDFLPLVEESIAEEENNSCEIDRAPELDMEVVFEEVKIFDIDSMIVEATVLDFLPIVIANKETAEIPETDLKALIVDYEVIVPNDTLTENHKIEEITEIIVDCEELGDVVGDVEKSLQEMEVVYEEISSPPEITFNLDRADSGQFDIEVVFNNNQPPLHIQKQETSEFFEIEVDATEVETVCRPLNELDVVCEIVHGDDENKDDAEDLPQWLLDEIARENTTAQGSQAIKMEGPDWEEKESEMMDKIKSYFEQLPRSEDPNKEINENIQLLDDIALFGDEREIPLLQELIKKEDKTETKERIDALMKRFMGNDAYGSGSTNMAPYSVFEELFRNCDTESKLILLDEIASIGDHKEIYFLEQLVNDPNKKICKASAKALKLLNDRNDQVEAGQEKGYDSEYEHLLNTMELNPPKEPDMFEIDFELTPEEPKSEKKPSTQNSWFASFFSKLGKKPTK